MFRSKALRPIAGVVLVTFTALTLQPLTAAAQQPSAPKRQQTSSDTSEERFSRTLNEIHEILKEVVPQSAMPHKFGGSTPDAAGKSGEKVLQAVGPKMRLESERAKPLPGVDIAAKVKALRGKYKELKSLEAEVSKGFKETESYIRDKNLPAEILARHEQGVAEYDRRKTEFTALMDSVEAADDGKGNLAGALTSLGEFMAKYPNAKTHTPTDPNNLPWGSPKPVTRAPYTSPAQFKTSRLFGEPVQVAQAGSLSGISLPNTVLPTTPTPADTAPTEDVQITQPIKDLATSLGNNPVKIYNWVHNNIQFIPTYGSIQGSDMTLQAKRGNAFDTASLLIALFRAANIPTRYVYGTIEVPADKAMNWVGGVTGPQVAMNLIGQGGIPVMGVTLGGQIGSIRLEHVWVEAYVDYTPSRGAINRNPNTWVPMDASFKQYDVTPGIDFGTATPIDSAALLSALTGGATIDSTAGRYVALNSGAMADLLVDFGQRVDAYLRQNYPNATFEDGFGKRAVQATNAPILLGTLPYKTVVVGQRFNSVPANLRMGVAVKLYSSDVDAALDNAALEFATSLPLLGARRLGVTFVPATPNDQAVLNSVLADDSVLQLPAYLINVVPELRIDGAKQTGGPASRLGTDQIWELTLLAPWRDQVAPHRFTATSGGELVFGITGNGVTPSIIKQRMNSVPPDTAAENLHQMALHYWFEQDFFSSLQAAREKVGYQLLSAFGLFSSSLTVTSSFFGIPRAAAYLGREMDVAHLLVSIAAQDGSQRVKFGRLIGMQGSLLEGAVPEQLFGRPYGQGQSAVRLIGNANAQGIPIYVLDQSNADSVIPLLQINPDVKQDIQNAIAVGKMVTVSAQAPTNLNFHGVGYIIEDLEAGTGAYLIAGGLNGMALADCACEKVKKPVTFSIRDIILTIIILAMLAALVAASGGLGGPAVPAALVGLMLLFGLTALYFPVSSQASTVTPPACCMTAECGKPDLFRGGRALDPNLQRIRLNWTNQRTGDLADDVGYQAGPIVVPPQTTCDTADLIPGLSDSITVVGGSGGASHDEFPGNVSVPTWKLPKDTFPPPQLCLVHDGVPVPSHWTLMPRQNTSFKAFCDSLRGFNPAYVRQ